MARSSPAFAAAPVALNQNSARMHSVFSRSFVGTSIAAPSSARRAYIVRRQDGPSMKIGIGKDRIPLLASEPFSLYFILTSL